MIHTRVTWGCAWSYLDHLGSNWSEIGTMRCKNMRDSNLFRTNIFFSFFGGLDTVNLPTVQWALNSCEPPLTSGTNPFKALAVFASLPASAALVDRQPSSSETLLWRSSRASSCHALRNHSCSCLYTYMSRALSSACWFKNSLLTVRLQKSLPMPLSAPVITTLPWLSD